MKDLRIYSFLLLFGMIGWLMPGVDPIKDPILFSYFTNDVGWDSLPAGTKINLEIRLPGDATGNKIQYTIPAPAVVVTPTPKPTGPLSDGFVLGTRSGNSLISWAVNGKYYIAEQMADGKLLVRGTNILLESSVTTSYSGSRNLFAGGETAYGGLVEPVGFTPPSGYTRNTFKDGAVYYARSSVDDEKGSTGVTPLPEVIPPVVGTAQAVRNAVAFNYSSQPNRVNRMQSPSVPAYRDGWKMKQTEIITGGNGGITETPDELRKRGVNWFNACWFYCSDDKPFGLPKATDNLFYEYTGNYWAPYHTNAYLSVVTDLTQIGNQCIARLPTWNSVPQNGLIDGVATVKEANFNLEYYWFLQSDWDKLGSNERNTRYYNYAINQTESLQDTYNRGGIDAIQAAQHQKFRNIIALSVLYLNANCNGMKAFYGDFWGLSGYADLSHWNKSISATAMLSADVNDRGLFPEANEEANAGTITLSTGQSFYASGNLNALQLRRNCYNYEFYTFISSADYQAFSAISKDASVDKKDIRPWLDKIKPSLTRPYDMAYHILLDKTIAAKKGWNDYKEYWQNQHIYEGNLLITDYPGEAYKPVGAWVPWTLGSSERPTKIPLHPEVQTNLTFLSRMHYDGKYTWGSGCCAKMNLDGIVGENLNANVHSVSREAEAAALSEIDQYNDLVFTADKRQHIGDVPVLAPSGQYVTGDPSVLLRNNAPLVTAVDSPSTGWELYYVYVPHQDRNTQTTVKWKSPVDGALLSGIASGWGGTLYARKR